MQAKCLLKLDDDKADTDADDDNVRSEIVAATSGLVFFSFSHLSGQQNCEGASTTEARLGQGCRGHRVRAINHFASARVVHVAKHSRLHVFFLFVIVVVGAELVATLLARIICVLALPKMLFLLRASTTTTKHQDDHQQQVFQHSPTKHLGNRNCQLAAN